MKKLVHNVVWPAVAGNVLWSFLQLLSDPTASDPAPWPRLVSLLLVGAYLSIDWIHTENEPQINDFYWIADVPLAAALAAFAVATQLGVTWAPIALAAAFLVATVGHCFGAWDKTTSPSSCKARAGFAGINVLGPIVLFIGTFLNQPLSDWSTPVAVLLVVSLFLLCRKTVASW
ncbi:MAG: hypothetical protein MRJ68_02950 [Nitrospira sp.]|nr:hypothetical protein [Nitrospira sp.]